MVFEWKPINCHPDHSQFLLLLHPLMPSLQIITSEQETARVTRCMIGKQEDKEGCLISRPGSSRHLKSEELES